METCGGRSGPGEPAETKDRLRSLCWPRSPVRELGLAWELVVEETVKNLAVIHQSTGSEVPHVVVAEGPIGIVIGEIDNRSVIAGTDLA